MARILAGMVAGLVAGCGVPQPVAGPAMPGLAMNGLAMNGQAMNGPATNGPAVTWHSGLAALTAGPGPDCLSAGGAVHIGRGRFLTAAHLVDGTQGRLRGCDTGAAQGHGGDQGHGGWGNGGEPWLVFDGQRRQAALLRAGQADWVPGIGLFYVDGRDVALLRLMPVGMLSAGLPPVSREPVSLAPQVLPPAWPPCAEAPRPGQMVELLTPLRRQRASIAGTMREADSLYGGYAELALRLEPGESGGAVLDPARQCLLGLVSHRAEGPAAGRTRIVPAAVLRGFLGE